MKFKRTLKVCCVAALVVVAFFGLGPSKWQPRSGLGWEIDHFAGYFVITLMFCLAWPRRFVVGGPRRVRVSAGGLASYSSGSLVQFLCGLVQLERSAGGGSAC
jgi:hypothetical protein